MSHDDPVSTISTERVLAIASELVAIDTQNPPGDTRVLAEWVERFLDNLGLATDVVATDPAKPNVLATLPGTADRTLLYNGHLDTVPFDAEEWTYDPLGEHDGERLYGRGATDMKGPLAAMLHAIEAFVKSGSEPPADLTLAVVSDEETGGDAGVATLLERNVLKADGCVIGETTCSGGRHSVTVADRGSIWLTLSAEGTAAHGSRPTLGTNAIDRLWDALTTLRSRLSARELPISDELVPIIDESVAYYEGTMDAEVARRLFERPSVNLGTIGGGESVNTVPRTADAQVDIRLTAGVETNEVLADIRDCLSEHPNVTITDVSWSVGTYESLHSPLVDAVTRTVRTVTDERIYRRSATGGGDAKKFRQVGIPTVEFAFGTDTAHAVDEYTTADALTLNAEVYTRLPEIWLSGIE